MKTRTFLSSKWLAGLAGFTLFLSVGCRTESDAQTSTATNTLEQLTNSSLPLTTSLAAQTNQIVQTPPELPPDLSPGVADIVKLAQAGVGEDVLLAYVTNAAVNVRPTPNEIVYLSDLGVSDRVITVLLQRGTDLPTATEGATNNVAEAAPAPVPAEQPIQTAPPDTAYSMVPQETAPAAPPSPQPEAVAVQVPPPQPVVIEDFRTDLAPYGSWVQVDDYGLCWCPTVAVIDPGWRPYVDRGRWIYTDCGWYWQSDYSWGWAPFHYGRWASHGRFGWVWVPDTVWGPSWVSWRYTDAYCGWAPLPPAARFHHGLGLTYHNHRAGVGFDFGLTVGSFTFVALNHFHDRHPAHHRIPHHQVHDIYRHSRVVNNITYNRNTVINVGPGRERIAAASRQQIRPVAIKPVAAPQRGPGRVERMDSERKTLAVYRPELNRARAASPAAKSPVLINRPDRPAAPTANLSERIMRPTEATRLAPSKPVPAPVSPGALGESRLRENRGNFAPSPSPQRSDRRDAGEQIALPNRTLDRPEVRTPPAAVTPRASFADRPTPAVTPPAARNETPEPVVSRPLAPTRTPASPNSALEALRSPARDTTPPQAARPAAPVPKQAARPSTPLEDLMPNASPKATPPAARTVMPTDIARPTPRAATEPFGERRQIQPAPRASAPVAQPAPAFTAPARTYTPPPAAAAPPAASRTLSRPVQTYSPPPVAAPAPRAAAPSYSPPAAAPAPRASAQPAPSYSQPARSAPAPAAPPPSSGRVLSLDRERRK